MEKFQNIAELSLAKRTLIFLGLIFFYKYSRFIMIDSNNVFVNSNQTLVWTISLLVFLLFLIFLVKGLNLPLATNPFKIKKIVVLLLGVLAWYGYPQLEAWLLRCGLLVLVTSANQMGLDTLPYYTVMFFASIEAPLIEELLFRGFFFKYFFQKNTRWNKFLLVFVSGLLFGLMHMDAGFDWANWINYSVMGWLLGSVRFFSGDIKMGMTIHFLNNAWPYIMNLLQWGIL